MAEFSSITLATTLDEAERGHAVLKELRPTLTLDEFRERFPRHQAQGYEFALGWHREQVVCVAGFRRDECWAWGRYIYVYDLVTASPERSKGFGAQMLDWLVAFARERDMDEVHLDSGVVRFGAHRFYLEKRMRISDHHFRLELKD